MEQQLEIVNNIMSEIQVLQIKEKDLKSHLEFETQKLQDLCRQIGHQYNRHGGWDGHRNTFYYVCQMCHHNTSYNVDKWIKDYSY